MLVWLLAAAAFAGRRARRAAIHAAMTPHGAVALPAPGPGGVVVDSAPVWDAPAVSEAGATPARDLMVAAQQVAYRCFDSRFSYGVLDTASEAWAVTVDATVGPGSRVGPALADGIALDGELDCLADGLAGIPGPPVGSDQRESGPYGMTFRVTSVFPQAVAGRASATLDDGQRVHDERALRFQARAALLAEACVRMGNPLPSGMYTGDGAVVLGAPEGFAACWAENAGVLEPFVDVTSRFTLDYRAP